MITRIYQCPVIGSGTEDDPFRPSVADAGVSQWSSLSDGLVSVTTDDHDAIAALPGVTLIG